MIQLSYHSVDLCCPAGFSPAIKRYPHFKYFMQKTKQTRLRTIIFTFSLHLIPNHSHVIQFPRV